MQTSVVRYINKILEDKTFLLVRLSKVELFKSRMDKQSGGEAESADPEYIAQRELCDGAVLHMLLTHQCGLRQCVRQHACREDLQHYHHAHRRYVNFLQHSNLFSNLLRVIAVNFTTYNYISLYFVYLEYYVLVSNVAVSIWK